MEASFFCRSCRSCVALCGSSCSARIASSTRTRTRSLLTSANPSPAAYRCVVPPATESTAPAARAATRGVWPGRIPNCPSTLVSRTSSQVSVTTRSSRGTISSERGMDLSRHRLGLRHRALDGADHVERLLGELVVLAVEQFLEGPDGVLELHVLALDAGERLGDAEGLRQESLDLAGASDRELVLVGQLVHSENGDDVLQLLVALQDRLHAPGHLVVLLADDAGIEDAAGRVERIHRRVDADLGEAAGEHRGRV